MEHEFTAVTLTKGFILILSVSIVLILFFDSEALLPRFSVYFFFLLHQVLGCDRAPAAALWGCPPYPALLCPLQSSHQPSTHTFFPCPSSVPENGFWTSLFRKGKENHFLIHN